MSRSWLFVLLLLTFAGFLDETPDARSQSGTPTLPETTQWLESHLVGVQHTTRKTSVAYQRPKKDKPFKETDRQVFNTSESVSVAHFDGCSLTLGQLTKGDDYTVVTISTIPLDRMNQASIKVEKTNPVHIEDALDSSDVSVLPSSVFVLTLDASTKAVSWKRKSSGNVPLEETAIPYDGTGPTLRILSDDDAMPPRLANAFNYAIKMCHANVKPEPF